MIKTMFFSANGNYASYDAAGEQVYKEQGSAWMAVLQDKLDRGVVDDDTRVMMNGWEEPDKREWTVGELVKRGNLKRKGKSR